MSGRGWSGLGLGWLGLCLAESMSCQGLGAAVHAAAFGQCFGAFWSVLWFSYVVFSHGPSLVKFRVDSVEYSSRVMGYSVVKRSVICRIVLVIIMGLIKVFYGLVMSC